MPMLSEPVTGSISLQTKTTGLQLLALRSDGRVIDRSEPVRDRESLTIQLPTARGTHWYVLKSTEPEIDVDRTKTGGSAN
jgi:hypothetical protein